MKVVRDNQTSLLTIDPIRVGPNTANNSWDFFNLGSAREALHNKFQVDATYQFLRTHANPQAQKIIPYPKDSDCPDPFSDVIHLYQIILSELVEDRRLTDQSYPLVEVSGVHGLDWGRKRCFYPTIWAFSKEDEIPLFRNLVDGLQNEEVYALACAKEAPHNYHRREIDLLHQKDISPLTIDDRAWTVSGRNLKDAIDFLCNFRYLRTHTK
ncbi:MAG TPA: hypothetical protein VJA23_01930 [Candidatus Nanoarchaeia archaeon]|nr:hypothetical protein [Candidatus Nanoarchaeia archaeon]